ncbi:hypothetical protein [Variovorax atrisoli]|uniref:hypothetical protein n=1 Tax=Variovorax atrisoli TaxID=3394203 RepID=UPI003396B2AF
MKQIPRLRLVLALCAVVATTACGRAALPVLPYPAIQSSSLLTQYVFALRAAEKRQTAYPDEPLWLHDEGGRSVDTVLNADNAAMVFYGLAHAGVGNERVTNEILNGLPPILQRYETAFEKSQGKWYQEEYVETIGIQLAMLTMLQPKLSNVLPGPERMIYRGAKPVPAPISDNAQQLLQFYKTSQVEAKNGILAKAGELAGSERLKPPAKERLQTLLARYR